MNVTCKVKNGLTVEYVAPDGVAMRGHVTPGGIASLLGRYHEESVAVHADLFVRALAHAKPVEPE